MRLFVKDSKIPKSGGDVLALGWGGEGGEEMSNFKFLEFVANLWGSL